MEPNKAETKKATTGTVSPIPIANSVPSAPPMPSTEPLLPSSVKHTAPENPDQQIGQSRNGNVPSGLSPFLVRIIEDDEPGSFERRPVKLGVFGLFISTLSFIAASIAAYFVFQQFKEMADQTELLSRSAEQARKDSKESGAATARQLSLLQGQLAQQVDSMRLDQRAWVSVTGISGYPEVGKPWQIRLTYRNTGKTVAKNLTLRFALDNEPSGAIRAPDDLKYFRFSNGAILSPGSVVNTDLFAGGLVESPRPMPQNIFDGYAAGTMQLRVLGEFTYEHIFGQKHYTKFCYDYAGMAGTIMHYDPCKTANSAN
jgi:hypothetical protein